MSVNDDINAVSREAEKHSLLEKEKQLLAKLQLTRNQIQALEPNSMEQLSLNETNEVDKPKEFVSTQYNKASQLIGEKSSKILKKTLKRLLVEKDSKATYLIENDSTENNIELIKYLQHKSEVMTGNSRNEVNLRQLAQLRRDAGIVISNDSIGGLQRHEFTQPQAQDFTQTQTQNITQTHMNKLQNAENKRYRPISSGKYIYKPAKVRTVLNQPTHQPTMSNITTSPSMIPRLSPPTGLLDLNNLSTFTPPIDYTPTPTVPNQNPYLNYALQQNQMMNSQYDLLTPMYNSTLNRLNSYNSLVSNLPQFQQNMQLNTTPPTSEAIPKFPEECLPTVDVDVSDLVKAIEVGKIKKKPNRWTVEEDELLLKSVIKYDAKDWKSIAEEVPNRSHVQCLQRWRKALDPSVVKGHWHPEEDARLLELVKKNPKNWGYVAKEIVGRTPKQCRERFHNHLDPTIKKGNWTFKEDELIVQIQKKLGNKWAEIAKRLEGRTENSVKIRWKSIKRQIDGLKVENLNKFDKKTIKKTKKKSKRNTMDKERLEKLLIVWDKIEN